MSLKSDILDLSRQDRLWPLSPWFSAHLDTLIADGSFPDAKGIETLRDHIIGRLVAFRADGPDTAVLGMSGGVDSALTAALLKAAGWRVIGHTLPISQNPEETRRGEDASIALGLEHVHIDLGQEYEALRSGLARIDPDLKGGTGETLDIRRGNLRARLRMIALYDQARRHDGLVASTDNFSELTAGFWTLHGDVGDLAPIQTLLKSWEVPALARISGVPEETWRATPTDGLGISHSDEDQLGASYLEWDILILSVSRALARTPGLDLESLRDAIGVQEEPRAAAVFARVMQRMGSSWFKRHGTVITPHPFEDRPGLAASIDARFFMPKL